MVKRHSFCIIFSLFLILCAIWIFIINLSTSFIESQWNIKPTKNTKHQKNKQSSEFVAVLWPQSLQFINNKSTESTIFNKTCIIHNSDTNKCYPTNCDNNNSTHFYNGLMIRKGDIRRKSPLANAMCTVSERYKFIYLHQQDIIGTAMMNHLQTCLSDSIINKKYQHKILHTMPCKHIKFIFEINEYFIWTLVGNPYLQIMKHWNLRSKFKRKQWSLTDMQSLRRFMDISDFQPQKDFVLDHKNCPSVDYVAKIENMPNDLKVIMERIWNKYSGFPMEKCMKEVDFKLYGFQKRLWLELMDGNDTISKIVYNELNADFVAFGYHK